MISTIIIFLFKRWDIALLKKRIEITHNNLTSTIFNQQINIQNIKQKVFEFRFASSISASLLVTMTLNEFATTISEFASMKFYY